MITEKQSVIIKKLFGPGASQKIADRIKRKGHRNRNGEPYKAKSINDVLNQQQHSVLEDLILKVWEEELDKRERRSAKLIERSKAFIL